MNLLSSPSPEANKGTVNLPETLAYPWTITLAGAKWILIRLTGKTARHPSSSSLFFAPCRFWDKGWRHLWYTPPQKLGNKVFVKNCSKTRKVSIMILRYFICLPFQYWLTKVEIFWIIMNYDNIFLKAYTLNLKNTE